MGVSIRDELGSHYKGVPAEGACDEDLIAAMKAKQRADYKNTIDEIFYIHVT